jgi:hypothetical protein
VPLEQPLKFRVVYPGGALVRSGVELSSSVVGTIPAGSSIIVTEKRFSNTPSYRCVPRLKLGDGSGWISTRINSPPPDDLPVVELLGLAGPTEVGDYALHAPGGRGMGMAAAPYRPQMPTGAGDLMEEEEEAYASTDGTRTPTTTGSSSGGLALRRVFSRARSATDKDIERAFTDIS